MLSRSSRTTLIQKVCSAALAVVAVGLCGCAPVAATTTDTPAPTSTPIAGLSGQIAYVRKAGGVSQVFVMNADGSDRTQLTDTPFNNDWPVWSPDGKRIAFETDKDGWKRIYVMNPDGSDQRPLTDDKEDNFMPSWSPDGKSMAFVSWRDGNMEIYRMDIDPGGSGSGTHITRLTDSPNFDWMPRWSPDGKHIAFATGRDGNWEIYVMNADPGSPASPGPAGSGSNQTRLTNSKGYDADPNWSPDGKQIAFTSTRGGHRQVTIMNADGSDPHALIPDEANDNMYPAWSSDGKWIVFTEAVGNYGEIFVAQLDGTRAFNVTRSPTDSVQAAWRPERQ